MFTMVPEHPDAARSRDSTRNIRAPREEEEAAPILPDVTETVQAADAALRVLMEDPKKIREKLRMLGLDDAAVWGGIPRHQDSDDGEAIHRAIVEFCAREELDPAWVMACLLGGAHVPHRLIVTFGAEEGQKNRRAVLREYLGHGGMGSVYLASELGKPDERFVVKIAPREARDAEWQCEREALRTIGDLIGYTRESDDAGGRILVMPHYDGVTLQDLLGHFGGKLPPQLAALIALRIAEKMRAIGEKHALAHLDIKPANIIITVQSEKGDGVVDATLIDWGIAQTAEALRQEREGVCFTPSYGAPEQMMMQAHPHSDQYALASVLYQMLAGQRPSTATTIGAIQKQKTMNDPWGKGTGVLADINQAREETRLEMLTKGLPNDAGHAIREAIASGLILHPPRRPSWKEMVEILARAGRELGEKNPGMPAMMREKGESSGTYRERLCEALRVGFAGKSGDRQ